MEQAKRRLCITASLPLEMSLLGQERRFGHIEPMSVLPPLATAIATCRADAKCQ
jgi:hypothetical protein